MWTWRNSIPVLLAALIIAMLAGCGGNSSELSNFPAATSIGAQTPQTSGPVTWPADLPQDTAQPWEQLDASGHVIPANERSASALNANSEFVAGVERYTEGGTAADNGEATSLSSAAGSLSWSMYRIPLGGDEPGVVTVDANLTAGRGYYVGLANYGTGAWDWHGPFMDNHVRVSTADTSGGSDYTSNLGSVFACVVANDGAACDVIGVGVNPVATADTEAPPAPDAPTVTPVDGGLELEWMPVVAGDLAGYRVYSSGHWFFDGQGTGVEVADSLEGLTRHVLSNLDAETFVRISAVDISGNESPLSDIVSAEPLAAAPPAMQVTASAPSGALNDTIEITATGADSYDFDTNGDGTYDITGDTTGVASVDTTSLGIIRPTVRGTSGSGTSVALGGVSVIIAGNSRPVASASASPTTGVAPLDVTFSGSDSMDFDGSIVGGGWDFDGDGTYDVWSDNDTGYVTSSDYTYTIPGVYNAKLKVVDDQGAWDVDTVAVLAVPPPDTGNKPPVAVLSGSPLTGTDSVDVTFDAGNSYDPDGTIADYEWDFDGDGKYSNTTQEITSRGNPTPQALTYYADAPVTVTVRVTDNDGTNSTASAVVAVHGWRFATVDSAGTTGNFPSLVVVDGHPAISYEDFSGGDLNYVRATDFYGRTWGSPITVDAGQFGSNSSMAIIDGRPAITYGYIQVKYAIADDPQGSSWPSPNLVESSALKGSALTEVDGNPASFMGRKQALSLSLTHSIMSGPLTLQERHGALPLH